MAKNIRKKPQISVVMSVYNGAEYLDFAIKSILSQTFKDFEFIIINDGSTDDSLKIIKSFKDSRIKLINQENRGLVASLNMGISLSAADIIARQDADDISLPDRFALEYKALQLSPETIIVGSSMITINESGDAINIHKVLLSNLELKQELIVRSPFAHGSVMLRKSAFNKAGGYKEDDSPAEDYGLWLRMANYGNFVNIDKPLYKYRENPNGISAQNSLLQQNMTKNIRESAWRMRATITPKNIKVNQYKDTDDGELRIERIVRNILYGIKISVITLNMKYFIKYLLLIIKDKSLRRKSIRLLLITIKL